VRWEIAPSQQAAAKDLSSALGISSILAQCLLNRGWMDEQSCLGFLEPRLKTLRDPFLLPDMGKAVQRLLQARNRGETLVIFGDYDVDGITSTAILVNTLRPLGWRVHFYLPHRMVDGYGLSPEAVEKCLSSFPVTLLLAVDCGSTSTEVIADLQGRNIDVLVLDHHQIGAPPPPAHALVNPLLLEDSEQHGLCSAALAFKMAHALVKTGRERGWKEALDFDVRELLDLTALGVIADVVPLRGENRIFASAGLNRLAGSTRPGIAALKEVAGIKETIDVRSVAFQLAPRLNAAGRLESAMQAHAGAGVAPGRNDGDGATAGTSLGRTESRAAKHRKAHC
jgi:single-stranded-DNA-specific exonuclease